MSSRVSPAPSRRIRRSVLFTPGLQMDRVAKALAAAAADTLVIDWEDAVAPAEKAKAREATKTAWSALPPSRTERVIRVNAMGTEWHRADVEAAVALAPDAIMIPKAEDATELTKLSDDMWRVETETSLRQLQVKLLFILETGRGIENALDIASAAPQRLEAIVFGAEDYQVAVGG